ncbi:MAG: twin-arginine translocation signal domain-containing protein, partial [Prevotellaceae bacterium]|nr:twin-arginine translocation signal domain-containing protein [Prevotellaceae bacterium]
MTTRRDFLKQSSIAVAGGLLGGSMLSISACATNEIALSNRAGVKCLLQKSEQGWTLGTISFNGKPLET